MESETNTGQRRVTSFELSKLIPWLPIQQTEKDVLRILADHYPNVCPGVKFISHLTGIGTTRVRIALRSLERLPLISADDKSGGDPHKGSTYEINVSLICDTATEEQVKWKSQYEKAPQRLPRHPSVGVQDEKDKPQHPSVGVKALNEVTPTATPTLTPTATPTDGCCQTNKKEQIRVEQIRENKGGGSGGGKMQPAASSKDRFFKSLLRKLYHAGGYTFDGKNRDTVEELLDHGFSPTEILLSYEDYFHSLSVKDRQHAPTRFCLGAGETIMLDTRIRAFITSTEILDGIKLSEEDVEAYILPALPEGRDCWFQLNGAWQMWVDDQIESLLKSFRREHAVALAGIQKDSDAEFAYRKEHFRGAVEIANFLPAATEYFQKYREMRTAGAA